MPVDELAHPAAESPVSADFDSPSRRLGVGFMRAVLGAFWGVRVSGLENVPRAGPLLVACNHVSLADPPLLGTAIDRVRKPRFLSKRELFENPLIGRYFRSAGCIPLDRRAADVSALKEALETLAAGGSVAIFPEGTRVKDGERRAPKLGVAYLAAKSRAPVLPARVLGTGALRRTRPLEVRFGAALTPPPDDDRETARAFARAVMDAIYSL
ncbi:MAG: 1-acyl-sn-glycerol-3-phosphate acyltransferase [Elusimicrobia bacterium]|nr:1-acyl-sn-glycerol-3-phosphate acyltransferase [Elusimicrobiota bacterium]